MSKLYTVTLRDDSGVFFKIDPYLMKETPYQKDVARHEDGTADSGEERGGSHIGIDT